MSADALLSRLERSKKTGRDRWLARCPAHEDRRPSLSIRELGDGRTLVHCFGGCDVESVLSAVGLGFSDLFPEGAVDHAPRVKKPYSVRDVVHALRFELTVAFVLLADVAANRPLDGHARGRAGMAAGRIIHLLGELDHAA
jgi:hypothetical protein